MIKKASLAIVAIAIVTIAVLLYLFFKKEEGIPSVPDDQGAVCLVFQGIDPQSPCYQKPAPVATSTSGGVRQSDPFEVACASASNPFERDECISTIAVEKRDASICGSVEGSLAKDDCVKEVKAAPAASSSPASSSAAKDQSFASALQQYFNQTTSKKASVTAGAAYNPPSFFAPTPTTATSQASLETQVLRNLGAGATLVVYSASRYQVAPGGQIKIYGAGFAASNTVHIGTFVTTAASSDGNSLSTQAPATLGEYEIWVTNDKGSSRNEQRPIKISVTDSPKPLPTISGASPMPVPLNGTVTLTGTGFSATNNVFTSMGTIMGVASSNGTSLSFKVSDLEYVNKIKDMPQFKGRVMSVLVNLQADGGTPENMFKFDVQF